MKYTVSPYIVHCGDPADGAVLVFADSAQRARMLAWPHLRDWCDSFTDLRARQIREHQDYIFSLYNGEPVIKLPPLCPRCKGWGAPIRNDGRGCTNCYQTRENPA